MDTSSAEDFVQNTGSSINSFQEMKLTLYYADSSGEKLQKEEDTVRYNSNESKERVVVAGADARTIQ